MHTIIFYHNPMSRSAMVQWMLEEIEADYQVRLLSFDKGEHKSPEFLAINPMGKLPTMDINGTIITETPAIIATLADLFPEKNLAPAIDSPKRGSYYRWLFFGAGCIDPALTDKYAKRSVGEHQGMNGYGSYEDTTKTIEHHLLEQDYVVGAEFSAADIYIAAQLGWGMQFGTLEQRDAFVDYVERCQARDGYQRSLLKTQQLMQELNQ